MGKPINISKVDGHIEFSLTNRRDSSKESIRILIDEDDFNALVKDTKCWGLHRKSSQVKTTYYVRRTLSSGKNLHLHREIVGLESIGSIVTKNIKVVDHINENSLDNRRINLEVKTSSDNISKHYKTRI